MKQWSSLSPTQKQGRPLAAVRDYTGGVLNAIDFRELAAFTIKHYSVLCVTFWLTWTNVSLCNGIFLCGCRCDCVCGCAGVVLAVNGEAAEGRNMNNDNRLNRSHMRCVKFTTFYLCILTFVGLNCLLVLFCVEFEWPKRQIYILCFYGKVILYLYAGFVSSGTTNVTTEWQTWHEPTKLYPFILWPYFKVTAVSRFKLQKKCSFIYLEALREFWLHRLYHEYKSINWIQITDMFSDLTKTSTLAFSQFKMVLMGSKKPIIMPNVAFEIVPMFVWLTMALSRPFKEDCLALPLSTPLSSRRSMMWCPWLFTRR